MHYSDSEQPTSKQASIRDLVLQFVRFGITGGFMTLLGVGIYWYCASVMGFAPLFATFIAYVIAIAIGYVAHSQFSFRGHGKRDNHLRTTSRFFAGSMLSYGLNSLWVWILTGLLHGPAWWGIPAMVLVTPVIIFWVNRRWVFSD